MSRKTKKLIWSVPLVATLAIVGALAAFMTLAPNGVFADAAPSAPTITSVAPVADDLSTMDVVEGRTAIKVEWSAPDVGTDDPPITGYRIDAAVTDSQVWKTIMANTNSTATSYTHTGIKASTDPGTTVYYRVFAISGAGTGPVSAAGSTETVPQSTPGRTMNVEAEADGATAIDLSWDVPRDDGGKPIIGYRIHIDPPGPFSYAGPTSEVPQGHRQIGVTGFPVLDIIDNPNTGSDNIIIVPASTTSWTHKGLMEKRTYRYQVYAINDLGTSEEESNIDDATTLEAEEPDEPTNLRAVLNDNVVRLYWHWPASDGGAAITAFRIEVSKTSDGPGPEVDAGDAQEGNVVTDQTLGAADTVYVVFNVPASALAATGDAGDAVSVYDVEHSHGILVGQEANLTYRVYAETTAEAGTLRSTDSGETRVAIAICPVAAAVTATAAADVTCNEDEAADDDNPSNPRTPAGNNRVPGPLPRSGDDASGPAVTGSAVGYDQINLDWNPGSDLPRPVSYRVDVSMNGQKWSSRESDTRPITSPNYEHKRLKAGTTYYYRVFPVAGSQIGPASGQGPDPEMAANVITGAARAPGNVPMINADAMGRAGQITLTWDPPTFEEDDRPDDGGRKITHYLISYKKADGLFPATDDAHDNVLNPPTASTTEATTYEVLDTPVLPSGTKLVDVTMTMWEHKDLDADTSYRYQVRAINIAPRGVAAGTTTTLPADELLSKPLEHVDETGPAAVPAAPMYMIAEDARDSNSDLSGDRGVLLLWSAPAAPSGDDVDHYMIERKVMGEADDEWEVLVRSWPAAKSYYTDPDGPEQDEIRYYRVNASNDVGTSGWSNEARLPQHDEPHGARPPADTTLTAPTMVSAMGGTGELTVTWVDGKNAVGHLVLLLDGAEIEAMETAPAGNSHRFTGLSPGEYIAVVVSYKSTSDYHYDYDADSVQ